MREDETEVGLLTDSDRFHEFGMQWDEYEVPFDPTAAIDGDG